MPCSSVLIAFLLVTVPLWGGNAVTDFCRQPLGMKTKIIANDQITASSSIPGYEPRSSYHARLDNTNCWCADQSQSRNGQWVKVDLKHTFSVTGITIQGDPSGPSNYIKEFNLRYSVDLTNYVYVTTTTFNDPMKFTGATGRNQKKDVMFPNRPFSARNLEFRPTDSNGGYLCVRFELYGCLYVCGQGLGIEYGSALSSGFAMTSSSQSPGQGAESGRLNNPSAAWCASGTTSEFLQVDFGKIVTVSGIATQGSPSSASWVKDFYVDYGTTLSSLVTYQENTGNKLFIGNSDQNTIVVNWFRVRLQTRYVKIKPNTYDSGVCMRIEILGCNSDSVYEFGAENRALPDNRFSAYATTDFLGNGRYKAKDGRLNNDRPWGCSKSETSFLWFKVDLGRTMLVTAMSLQGDRTFGKNYFPDFKLQYTLDSANTPGSKITIKQESSSTEKVFVGNTNNAGVKFNLFEKPVSARYIQFIKNSNVLWDYMLTLEVYGRPAICSSSFGMVSGEPITNNPTVSASSGVVPDMRSKLNTPNSWCATTSDTNQFLQYDFGMAKVISGFAIQGDPLLEKWVETFKVQYGNDLSSLATYQEGGSDKNFPGCKSREGIVYHWFSSNLKTRYLRIVPLTWKTEICLRMNAYGCPDSECREIVGIQSSSSISDASMSSSSSAIGNGAHKGRFNKESVWEACQFGSCSPKESTGAKPWIQACLTTAQSISSIVIQGQGDVDNLAKVTEFSLKYSTVSSGTFFGYKHSNLLQKFRGPDGRYSSSQIDLPHTIIARCIRLLVETQSPSNLNVGLRWEMLGCASVGQVTSISIAPSSPSLVRNGKITLTCTVAAQPGVEAAWKNGSNTLTSTGIYQVGNDVVTNENINGETTKTLKITATPNSVINSFSTCTVTDSAQGFVECKHTLGCSAMYPGISSTSKSSTVNVIVTGLLAKPSTPSGMVTSSLTNTTASVIWNASVSDFPTDNYNVVLKKKSDGSTHETQNNLKTTTASFTGLSAYTDYTIEVSAKSSPHNINSDTGTFDFKTAGVPDAPSNVSAVVLSSTTVQVFWSEPVSLRGILYGYKVRYKMVSANSYFTNISAGTKTKLTISFLQPSKDYQFQVAATINGGTNFGQWSSVVTVKTNEGKPSQPQNLKLSSKTSSSVLVNITQPLRGNGVVRNYTVRYFGRKSYNRTFEHNGFITVERRLHSEFTSKTLSNLVPATNYTIDVAAVTEGGRGNFSERVTFETDYAGLLILLISHGYVSREMCKSSLSVIIKAPPKPTMENQGSIGRKLTVRINTASDINGPISEYRLSFLEGNAITCQQSSSAVTILPSKVPLKLEFIPGIKSVAHISTELKTLANYTLCYRAATTNKDIAYYSQFTSTIIERKYLEKLNVDIFKSEAKDISFVIPLKRGPENIKEYHIIVLESGNSSKFKDPLDWKPSELGRYDSSTYIRGTPYITGVLYNYVAKFEIGNGKEYVSSGRRRRNADQAKNINAPLKPNTEYVVFQRAYLSADIYFSSPWAGPFKTKEPLKSEPGETRSIEIIVGIIVPAIIVLALAVTVCYIRKRRSKKPKIQEGGMAKDFVPLSNLHDQNENPSYDHEYESLNNVRASAATEEPSIVSRGSSDGAGKLGNVPRKVVIDQKYPPVSVKDFARRTKELQKRDYQGINMEFENLDKGQQFAWDIAKDPANQQKNEHANIFPYDHSRVHLNTLPGDQDSDYINASHISDYTGKNKYIASQGPSEALIYDFWRMIWDKHVPAIIMLTQLVQKGKNICAQYWPSSSSANYGDINVSLKSNDDKNGYTIRCFSIQRENCRKVKIVYQYHLKTWPENGVPNHTYDLLNLWASFRRRFPNSINDPVVVHCSAGIGQTGTFILIDAMMELVQAQQKVDVFNYLNFIRSQRIGLVQVKEQYIFAYDALLEVIGCIETALKPEEIKRRINMLKSKGVTGKTKFEEEFERLSWSTKYFTEVNARVGSEENNTRKNRTSEILPNDVHRVVLRQAIYENNSGSDYINATYVNGYSKFNAFVATQHPLPETIDDLWLMIQQTEVSTVVLLGNTIHGSKDLPIFWPPLQTAREYGGVLVNNQSEESNGGRIERMFTVRNVCSAKKWRNLTMIQFEGWTDHGVPKDLDKFLSLLNEVETHKQNQSEDRPLVIMCRDGAGHSGTFISISLILERFKAEQVIDVFEAVKLSRAFRPEFVDNADQYKFCYTAAQAVVNSYGTYANMYE